MAITATFYKNVGKKLNSTKIPTYGYYDEIDLNGSISYEAPSDRIVGEGWAEHREIEEPKELGGGGFDVGVDGWGNVIDIPLN